MVDGVIGFERRAGLGGWMGAVGAIAAIFVAWLLVQAEYLRSQRLEDGRVNAQISLIGNTASQFDPLVQQYIKLALGNDSKVTEYYHRRIDDPLVEKMIDLDGMPMNRFNQAWAREAIEAATEVFDFVWLAVVRNFPRCVRPLAGEELLLKYPLTQSILSQPISS